MSKHGATLTAPNTSEMDFPLSSAEWLKSWRKEMDLTQAELAEHASCTVFALRTIEAGERQPSKQPLLPDKYAK